jgi:ubiquinone/menaquinone biosynthesis C-methylase UbiE
MTDTKKFLTTSQWHNRYLQQSRWTRNIRKHLLSRVGIDHSTKILDIGCGTGVLEREFYSLYATTLHAVDLNHSTLRFAQGYAADSTYTQADGEKLPFRDNIFDISLCHFLLLWIKEPSNVLEEMARVTSPRGYILALAEPDYGGRIDFPNELATLGLWQIESLNKQGANPYIGRELRTLFHQVGLVDVEVGVLSGQWIDQQADEEQSLEWDVIEADLSGNDTFINQAHELKRIEGQAEETGKRILFVPTFYACGRVV